MKKHHERKTVAHYMRLPYTYEVTPDTSEGGFVVSVKELPGCLSQGTTVEEATRRVREAMELWISICLEDGREIPEPNDVKKYSGRFVVRIPTDIHRAVARAADQQGTSLNMFVATALARATGDSR